MAFTDRDTVTDEVGTGNWGTFVRTAFDKYVDFALRSEPLFRAFADKRPVNVDKPGHSVVFHLYNDLAVATTPLTETVDITPVEMAAPDTVTVTLYEYGNGVNSTELLRVESFTDLDPAVADIIAYNQRDTIDALVVAKLITGTQHVTSGAGTVETTPVAINTLTASDVFNSKFIRYAVAKLRGASVQPQKGNLYGCAIHPDVSHDLRADTAAGGWRLPHEYQAGDQIWAGEIGAYEGAFFIETPRAYKANDGNTSATVHRTLFMGKQALAEAVGIEPHTVIGPVVDSLMRFRPVGWKGLLGHSIYRQEALWRVSSGSSI